MCKTHPVHFIGLCVCDGQADKNKRGYLEAAGPTYFLDAIAKPSVERHQNGITILVYTVLPTSEHSGTIAKDSQEPKNVKTVKTYKKTQDKTLPKFLRRPQKLEQNQGRHCE